MKSIQIEMGRLLCRNMRDLLESEMFLNSTITYHESKGIFSRVFTIKGENYDVDRVQSRIENWMRSLGELK